MTEDDARPAVGPGTDRAQEIRALVEECLQRVETDGPAVFEEICARRSDLASAIRERLHMLHAAGLLDLGADGGEAPDAIPDRLGEFRLLQRLGGGGMGVVYLAEQTSLQRRVALKLVRPAQLFFPGARERFRREAEAVARLAHPGIVPIYTVGEEASVPFFAMEWVRGATLAEVLTELHGRDPAALRGSDLQLAVAAIVARREGAPAPGAAPASPPDSRVGRGSDSSARGFSGTWVAACLRLVTQAAAALQHAHERGVLHRDVKPSNLMLTPDGRVLLFDFGLAAAEGTSRITRSGSQLGSLAYMSPEQVRGEVASLDARSDVYSLGVTLYELLTLTTPYAAEDEQRLRGAILAAAPPLPRTRNPAVPRDAETVCLLAMDADRTRRYADPAAFARDLDNVLERRPIVARRPGPLLRARRLVQRHPAASTALVLGGLLVVGGPLAWGLWERRANIAITAALDEARLQGEEARRQGEEARRQGEEAAAQRDAARLDLARAMQAVDTMLARVGDKDLANIPQVQPVRRQLLTDALGFYEELLASHAGVPALTQAAARTARRIGELAMVSADWEIARSALDQARALFAELVESQPGTPTLLTELGDAWVGLGQVELAAGNVEASTAANAEARALFVRHLALDPGCTQARSSLAGVTNTEGMRLLREGRFEEAEAPLRESLAQLEALADQYPDDPENVRRAGFLQNNLGGLMRSLARPEEAEACYVAAERWYGAALALTPVDRVCRQELAGTRQNFANLLKELGRAEEAEALFEQALDSNRELVAQFPDSMDNLTIFALSASSLAVLQLQAERFDEAGPLIAEAVAAQERVVAAAPESPDMRSRLAVTLTNQSEVLSRSGRPAEARPVLERAAAEQQLALDRTPGIVSWQNLLRTQHQRLSGLCRELHDWDAAQAAADSYLADAPGTALQLRRGAGLYAELAAAVAASADAPARSAALQARALELLQQAIDGGFRDGADLAAASDMASLRDRPEFGALLEACAAGAP